MVATRVSALPLRGDENRCLGDHVYIEDTSAYIPVYPRRVGRWALRPKAKISRASAGLSYFRLRRSGFSVCNDGSRARVNVTYIQADVQL